MAYANLLFCASFRPYKIYIHIHTLSYHLFCSDIFPSLYDTIGLSSAEAINDELDDENERDDRDSIGDNSITELTVGGVVRVASPILCGYSLLLCSVMVTSILISASLPLCLSASLLPALSIHILFTFHLFLLPSLYPYCNLFPPGSYKKERFSVFRLQRYYLWHHW